MQTNSIEDHEFVHLHLHTEFSVLDGINRVETLPEHIKSIGQQAVAITDHGNVSGSYKFYQSCSKAGIKPIIGMEAYYTVQDRTAREVDDLGEKYYHLILLAQNKTGLQNLYELSSRAYSEGQYYKPRIDDTLLAELNEGIIATSACLGSRASQLILKGDVSAAEKLITHHAEIFKDRFLIEVQLHEDQEQQLVNRELIKIAAKNDLPLVLTNDCHYTLENEKSLHEQALCMQTNDVMTNPKRFSFGPIDVHVANKNWMLERAQRQGIPLEAITNTKLIADAIDSRSYFANIYNKYPTATLPEGVASWNALEAVSEQLLVQKLGGVVPQEYRDRMNFELKVIKTMGYSDYLLIVKQIIDGARELQIGVGPGRGSAAGSLVAYALGITQVDPIKYGLIFERFLNEGRGALPLILDPQMIKKIELATKNHTCSSTCGHKH